MRWFGGIGSSFTSPAAFLSNRTLRLGWPPGCMRDEPVERCAPAVPRNLVDPATGLADCTPRHTVTVCAPAPTRLAPGQAVVEWMQVDNPAGGNRPPPGTRLTVAGHEARVIIRGRKLLSCPPGSSESIVARVYYRPSPGYLGPPYSSWYEMDSCLRGPGLARLQAQVLSIFRSIRGV